MYTVSDAMTANPVTLRDTDHLAIAESLMRNGLEPIRYLPVLSYGRLVGILTQSDVLRAAASNEARKLDRVPVRDAMTRRVRTVRAGTPLRRAVQLLLKLKVGGLPVVDAHRTVVGILTVTDVVRFAHRLITGLDRCTDAKRRKEQPERRSTEALLSAFELFAELGALGRRRTPAAAARG
jgi:CBS domain-containing protein